ncbi:MAG: hypothetical protein Q8M07_13505 [Prosthecobacter sp.]|nr:hypothetical protein [Prosthecobacter sp.]
MTVAELEQRMRAWLSNGEYKAILFLDGRVIHVERVWRGADGDGASSSIQLVANRQHLLGPATHGEGAKPSLRIELRETDGGEFFDELKKA